MPTLAETLKPSRWMIGGNLVISIILPAIIPYTLPYLFNVVGIFAVSCLLEFAAYGLACFLEKWSK